MLRPISFLVVCLIWSGCGDERRERVAIVNAFDDAVNAHNVDAAMNLVADEAVVIDPMGQQHNGKEAFRVWLSGLMPGFKVESWCHEQSGDTVTWRSTVWSDAFQQAGVNPVATLTKAVFAGKKIKMFHPTFDAETSGKMRFAQFWHEVMGEGNLDAIDKYVAENVIEHEPLPLGFPSGREGVKAWFKNFREGFPDLKVTPTLLLADGDRVVSYTRWEGTNTGKFMGRPATNRKVSFNVIDIIRLENGKAVEHWGVSDEAAMMRQLGGKQ